MDSNLKHSIYLNDKQTSNPQQTNSKTQQILNEDHSSVILSINQSGRKKSMKYHQFQKTFINHLETPAKEETHLFNFSTADQQEIPHSLQFERNYRENQNVIQRLCHKGVRNYFQQCCPLQPLQIDPKWRAHRDQLTQRSKLRKEKLKRRIQNAAKEQSESCIANELSYDVEIKQKKISNFLKRQQFLEQQRKIMKQMRQFCIYGAIKVKQHF